MTEPRYTLHYTPADYFDALDPGKDYTPPDYEREGFIHCTDGVAGMVATANRFYAADPRPFVVLTVDLDALSVPWRYDDPERRFPHVYGPLDRSAVLGVVAIPRAADGTFLAFEP